MALLSRSAVSAACCSSLLLLLRQLQDARVRLLHQPVERQHGLRVLVPVAHQQPLLHRSELQRQAADVREYS